MSWLDWVQVDNAMLALVQRTLALRAEHECLRHDQWFADHAQEDQLPRVRWLGLDGQPLQAHDWHDEHHRSLVVVYTAPSSPALMVVFHPHAHEAPLKLEGAWRRVLDSTEDDGSAGVMTTPLVCPESSPPSQLSSVLSGTVTLPARSVWVLQAL